METAKENELNPFKYLMYLFEQLPQLPDPKNPEALDKLLPWSTSLPLTCRVFKSSLGKLANNDLTGFVNLVKAQSGKHISSEAAKYLLRDAQYVLTQK